MKKLLSLCSLMLMVQMSFACLIPIVYSQSSLVAIITDASNSEPIPFATIALYQNGEVVMGTYSDFEGRISLDSIPYGRYDIEIHSLGFIPVKLDSVFLGLEPMKMLPSQSTKLSTQGVMGCFEILLIDDGGDWDEEPELPIDIVSDSALAEEVSVEEAAPVLLSPVTIYPNPASTEVHVKSEGTLQSLLVYDLLGNVVKRPDLGVTDLNMSDLPVGAYIFQWTMDGVSDTQTVVKL